jgi:hypothetical protein
VSESTATAQAHAAILGFAINIRATIVIMRIAR